MVTACHLSHFYPLLCYSGKIDLHSVDGHLFLNQHLCLKRYYTKKKLFVNSDTLMIWIRNISALVP